MMQGEQHSQSDPQKNGGRFQWLPMMNSPAAENDAEGGLNVGQVLSSLRRRLPVIAGVATVVTAAAILRASTSTPTYQAGFEILARPVTAESQVISSLPETLSNKEQQQGSQKGVDPTTLKLLKSSRILSPIVKELKPKYPELNYDGLFRGLTVTPVPASEILSVSFNDENPDKVNDVLNLVADAYLAYSLEERLADVRQGIDFVEAQIPQIQNRVQVIQDNLQAFRQRYNLIDPESAGNQLAQQTSVVSQQRLENQVKLNETRALYRDLSQQLGQQGDESVASSATQENPRYQSLLSQILQVESDIAKESTLYRDNTPNIQVLRDQKRNLVGLLGQEGRSALGTVASKIRELEARNQILADAEQNLNRQVKLLSVISRQYVDIQQELKIATDNLNQFLAKREALRIDAGQRKTPWQILTPVTKPVPSAANVKRSAILGMVLGLLLGVAVALLLEKINNVLRSVEEVKDATKLPILGVIPFNADLEARKHTSLTERFLSVSEVIEFMNHIRPKSEIGTIAKADYFYGASAFLEAFRSFYTNIRLMNPDHPVRSLVITSASPGEGKSTISMNLAKAAAALDQKVLLVDTDLRLPQLQARLELADAYGLSDLISSDLALEQVVQPSLAEPNLFVVTAGQLPPDPTRLLSSKKMHLLMQQFTEAYDLVIYDTPPVVGLADAKLVAAKTDGIVLVVGLDKAKSSDVAQALESLRLSPVKPFGVVVNGAKDQVGKTPNAYNRYYRAAASDRVDITSAPVMPKIDE